MRCEIGKRLLVELDEFETARLEREPKRVAHGESFGDRHMLRPAETVFEEVRDPAGTIDEQRGGDRRATRLFQLKDNILQALRG